MTPERYKEIDKVFQAAVACEPQHRAGFLDAACGNDPELRKEVEALLEFDRQADSFIEQPALQAAAALIADQKTDSMVNRGIGPYRILSHLGSGGMGEVYLAQDSRLGRKVALKLLPFELTKDEHRVLRFKQEARTASALNHPNILTIYDIGESDSVHFIATEFVNGETLRHHIVNSPMAWQEALDTVIQAASALAAAHKAGIVHRDIKPENIMIRSDGYAKVLDFGIAKLTERKAAVNDSATAMAPLVNTEPGQVMGTPKYMSPEQVRGFDVDPRSDIFSLGAVLYEMVAGSHPFAGQTTGDIIAAVLEKEPPPIAQYVSDIPIQLQTILTRALQKDRHARYQVIEEMIDDLKRLKRQPESKEHQRSTNPVWSGGTNSLPPTAATNPQAVIETPQDSAGLTDEVLKQPTLTGGNLLGRVTNHKKGAALALAIVTATAMLSFLLYKLLNTNHSRQVSSSSISRTIPVTPHNIDDPSPIDLGVTNELTLDGNERTYFKTSLPAGEYKVVLDTRRAIGRNTNLQSSLSILDQDGGVLEPDVISFNVVDVDYRKVYRLSLKKPATLGFKLSSHQDKTAFWLTVLNESAHAPFPFFGKLSPTPIQEAQVISGNLDALESAYYILPLKRGDYKAILDFTNSEGRNTNIAGYLALLDEEGADQRNIIQMNEVDVSYRKLEPFSVKNDSKVIIRLKNDLYNVKYSMRILPASQ